LLCRRKIKRAVPPKENGPLDTPLPASAFYPSGSLVLLARRRLIRIVPEMRRVEM
jgi:hypothetical protein